MALKRFRIEVEGTDQEDVETQLDEAFLLFADGARKAAGAEFRDGGKYTIKDFECTDERISAIQRNGIPLMYGRRVFKVIEAKREEETK